MNAPLASRRTGRRLARIFLTGLAAVLPILVTVAVVVWLIGIAESMLGGLLRFLLPDVLYFQGLGLLTGIVLVFVAGLMTRGIVFRRALAWFDEVLDHVPLVKTVYHAVRDLVGFFSKEGKPGFSKVVIVTLPNLPIRMVGFVTVEDFSELPFKAGEDEVAVYLPMSYQIGGYTLLLPAQLMTPVEMSFEDAMRFVVTAGMSGQRVRGASAVSDAPAR